MGCIHLTGCFGNDQPIRFDQAPDAGPEANRWGAALRTHDHS
jgi:hypothetical protein